MCILEGCPSWRSFHLRDFYLSGVSTLWRYLPWRAVFLRDVPLKGMPTFKRCPSQRSVCVGVFFISETQLHLREVPIPGCLSQRVTCPPLGVVHLQEVHLTGSYIFEEYPPYRGVHFIGCMSASRRCLAQMCIHYRELPAVRDVHLRGCPLQGGVHVRDR